MTAFWGAIVVLGAIGFVSWPLLRRNKVGNGRTLIEDTEFGELLSQKDSTLLAISELESDYELGSLSKSDYQELRSKYEEKAFTLIKTTDAMRGERSAATVGSIDEEIEQRVSMLRSRSTAVTPGLERIEAAPYAPNSLKVCPGCGASVGADHEFCFRCGSALTAKCPKCSTEIRPGDVFCLKCGADLRALMKGAGR